MNTHVPSTLHHPKETAVARGIAIVHYLHNALCGSVKCTHLNGCLMRGSITRMQEWGSPVSCDLRCAFKTNPPPPPTLHPPPSSQIIGSGLPLSVWAVTGMVVSRDSGPARAGLGGPGCLSDWPGTKPVLWPVIKALGNSGPRRSTWTHSTHTHTHTRASQPAGARGPGARMCVCA